MNEMIMGNNRIYLSPPHMSGEEMKYIQQAFDENWIAPLGPNVDEFEKQLSDFSKIKHAAVLSSGTAAIHLALILLGIDKGDLVIVSTFTFSATINPIIYQRAIPLFIDSERKTWNMDPDLLEKALQDAKKRRMIKKIKAIIVVHLYGMPAKIDKIMEIANKYGIPVIEDAAEAMGSKYKEKALGSFGKLGVFSFNGNKIITTSGGGALLSNDKKMIQKSRFLASQARDKAAHYQHSKIGYNYRLSNILAGIGIGQVKVLNKRIEKRRENHFYYKKVLGLTKGISFQDEPNNDFYSNFWLTTLLIDYKLTKIKPCKISKVLEKYNIESRPLWKPMHLQPIFSQYPAYLNGTSKSLFDSGICLPSGSQLTSCEIDIITDLIKNIFI